jgi:hypothetical protein
MWPGLFPETSYKGFHHHFNSIAKDGQRLKLKECPGHGIHHQSPFLCIGWPGSSGCVSCGAPAFEKVHLFSPPKWPAISQEGLKWPLHARL